jgi:hypothetical protein
MADRLPDGLTLERNRDLHRRSGHVWYRRALLALVAVLPVLALLNVFGQHPTTTSAHTLTADLAVTAPARLRSGLIFQVRVQVTARQDIAKPQLVDTHHLTTLNPRSRLKTSPAAYTDFLTPSAELPVCLRIGSRWRVELTLTGAKWWRGGRQERRRRGAYPAIGASMSSWVFPGGQVEYRVRQQAGWL